MSTSAAARWRLSPLAAVAFTSAAAAGFVVVRPPVGDFWAAQARRYAALHGVGLDYWFAWFGGTVPGHYSLIAPYLLRLVDVGVLGAASTVAGFLLCRRLLRHTAHGVAAGWLAAVAVTFSLWSGRIPFALGTALLLAGLVAVAADRRVPAVAAGAAAALVSPVAGAFLVLGVSGVVLHDRTRRLCGLAAALAATACMSAMGLYYGLPGSEGFPLLHAAAATATTALLLCARPPAIVRSVVLVSIAACPILALVPNGMGTNFERFTWICLPVAVAATGQARRVVVFGSALIAVSMGVIGSVHDLYVAAQPMSQPSYVQGLADEFDRLPGLADYRVEVVPDGTHVAAFALLSHASLARGDETQSDNRLNSVLHSPALDAASYRRWLDENAVAYVALDRETLAHEPEDRLVRFGHVPYLRLAWSDRHWLLFAVRDPLPIAQPPARVTDADQARLVVSVPAPGRYHLSLEWSHLLQLRHATAGAAVERAPDGRTVLVAPAPGKYSLGG